MPEQREVSETYLTWCEMHFHYVCGIKWCKKKVWGVKIKYPCGFDYCPGTLWYPCFKTRMVKKTCYSCQHIRMECYGLWCYSYCCEAGTEYGSWTGPAFMMFGEKYNWSGGSFCFDEALDEKGPCKMPVDPQDSRPPESPGTYPPGDGGTVTGPGSSSLKTFTQETRIAGLGDFVKALTSAMGIKPCAGCGRRAERLNRLVPFHPRKDR